MQSTDKTRSVVNNVGRTLVKKKMLMLGLNKNFYNYQHIYL